MMSRSVADARQNPEWTYKLIDLVEERKHLWKSGDPSRAIATKQDRLSTWKDITAALGHARSEYPKVRRIWRNIRGMYSRHLHARKGEEPVTWQYFDRLSFLQPHTQRIRRNSRRYRNHIAPSEETEESVAGPASPAGEELHERELDGVEDVDIQPLGLHSVTETEEWPIPSEHARRESRSRLPSHLPPSYPAETSHVEMATEPDYSHFFSTVKGLMAYLTPDQRETAQKRMIKALVEFSAEVI